MAVGLYEKLSEFICPYPEEQAEVGEGYETKLGFLSTEESEAIVKSVDALFYDAPEAVKACVADNIQLIIDLVRAVKVNAHTSFQGIRSRERGLQLLNLNDPRLFTHVWGSTEPTNWYKEFTEPGVYEYIGTPSAPEITPEEEGVIIFGFLDTIVKKDNVNSEPESAVKAVKIYKNGKIYFQSTNFECQEFTPLEEPIIVLPESNFYIQARCTAGKTRMVPVGVKILIRTNFAKMFE
jgi:hypothetical protein